MGQALFYTVGRDNREAMLMAALLGAPVRSLAMRDGTPWALKYGNYFTWRGMWLIVRTSRIARPFWGVRADSLERFWEERFAVVLLTSAQRGWAFGDQEVKELVARRRWPLGRDHEFKVTGPLPEANGFASVDELRGLLRAMAPVPAPPDRAAVARPRPSH
jgi:hypothetical protein